MLHKKWVSVLKIINHLDTLMCSIVTEDSIFYVLKQFLEKIVSGGTSILMKWLTSKAWTEMIIDYLQHKQPIKGWSSTIINDLKKLDGISTNYCSYERESSRNSMKIPNRRRFGKWPKMIWWGKRWTHLYFARYWVRLP